MDGFESFKIRSIYSKIYEVMGSPTMEGNRPDKTIRYLIKERKQYNRIFGEQGAHMSKNAFKIYEAF